MYCYIFPLKMYWYILGRLVWISWMRMSTHLARISWMHMSTHLARILRMCMSTHLARILWMRMSTHLACILWMRMSTHLARILYCGESNECLLNFSTSLENAQFLPVMCTPQLEKDSKSTKQRSIIKELYKNMWKHQKGFTFSTYWRHNSAKWKMKFT